MIRKYGNFEVSKIKYFFGIKFLTDYINILVSLLIKKIYFLNKETYYSIFLGWNPWTIWEVTMRLFFDENAVINFIHDSESLFNEDNYGSMRERHVFENAKSNTHSIKLNINMHNLTIQETFICCQLFI